MSLAPEYISRQDKAAESIEPLGAFRIIQVAKGNRFGVDSLLLAEFVLPVKTNETTIDIGTGSCVIPLLLAGRSPVEYILGVEVQKRYFELAGRNVKLNGLSDRIKLLHADYRGLKLFLKRGSFDLVISNPPYVKKGCGRISRVTERAIARTELLGSLDTLTVMSQYLLSENGRSCYIYPAARLDEVLLKIEGTGLKPRRLRLVHPFKSAQPILFMVEATRVDGELVIEEPVFVDKLRADF